MIYLVTKNQELFESSLYKHISVKESLNLMKDWKVIQLDTETTGRDAHVNDFLLVQMGNDKANARIEIDTSTIDIRKYKDKLENTLCILQNAKFDLQFFYNYGIIIRKVYDIMIVEQFLHLGYPSGLILSKEEYLRRKCNYPYHIIFNKETGKESYQLSYALDAIAKNRLNIDIDKTIRSQIIWRGLDDAVIKYGAGDVTYLEKLMWSQVEDLKKIPNAMIGAKIECDFTPVIAYLEWCGIKLDENKWKAKMLKDKKHLEESIEALNNFVINTPILKKEFTYIDTQGDLFKGFNLEPQVLINWSSSPQVTKVAKLLGFNVTTTDKKTGENKESAMEKQLTSQKGINDEFLKLYFGQGKEGKPDYFPGYSGSAKVVSSFGQGHLNAINPNTGRIHTVYRALGAISGRMSSGSNQPNKDLAKLKHISEKDCKYPK